MLQRRKDYSMKLMRKLLAIAFVLAVSAFALVACGGDDTEQGQKYEPVDYGTATVYAAALEDRIKLAMPSCAMCTYKDSIGAMPHCTCNFIPHIAEYFDMGDLMALAYPKYYVQVSGKEDPIFPITGAIICIIPCRSIWRTRANSSTFTASADGTSSSRWRATLSAGG